MKKNMENRERGPEKHGKRWLLILLFVLLAAIVVVSVWWFRFHKQTASETAVTQSTVSSVSKDAAEQGQDGENQASVVTVKPDPLSKQSVTLGLVDEQTQTFAVYGLASDKAFRFRLEQEEAEGISELAVQAADGSVADTTISVEEEMLVLSAPQGGYVAGEIYSLVLPEGVSFADEDFEGVRSLLFTVQGSEKRQIRYQTSVHEVTAADVLEKEETTLRLKGEYQSGDIILVDTDRDQVQEAYALDRVYDEDNVTVADISIPSYDAVFRELDLYQESEIDFSQAQFDKEGILEALEESGILDVFRNALTIRARAADVSFSKDDIKVTVAREKDGGRTYYSVAVEVSDDEMSVSLTFAVSAKQLSMAKIGKGKDLMGTAIDLRLRGETKVSASIKEDELKDAAKELENKLEEEIREKLKKKTVLESGETVERNLAKQLLDVEIPITGPLSINLELGATAEFGLSGNLVQNSEVGVMAAIYLDLKEKQPLRQYAAVSVEEVTTKLSAETENFVGIELSAGLTALQDSLEVNISGAFGPYLDGSGYGIIRTTPESGKERKSGKNRSEQQMQTSVDFEGELELGLRAKLDAEATFDPWVVDEHKVEFSLWEKDIPLWKYPKDDEDETDEADVKNSQKKNQKNQKQDDEAMTAFSALEIPDMGFSSGAGAWGTGLTIESEGTFTGQYHDANMGITGEGYPNGELLLSNFSGRFKNIKKQGEFAFTMELDGEIQLAKPQDTTEIRNQQLITYTDAHGMAGGKTFTLYLPGMPIDQISEADMEVIYMWDWDRMKLEELETLPYYALINHEKQYAFIGRE